MRTAEMTVQEYSESIPELLLQWGESSAAKLTPDERQMLKDHRGPNCVTRERGASPFPWPVSSGGSGRHHPNRRNPADPRRNAEALDVKRGQPIPFESRRYRQFGFHLLCDQGRPRGAALLGLSPEEGKYGTLQVRHEEGATLAQLEDVFENQYGSRLFLAGGNHSSRLGLVFGTTYYALHFDLPPAERERVSAILGQRWCCQTFLGPYVRLILVIGLRDTDITGVQLLRAAVTKGHIVVEKPAVPQDASDERQGGRGSLSATTRDDRVGVDRDHRVDGPATIQELTLRSAVGFADGPTVRTAVVLAIDNATIKVRHDAEAEAHIDQIHVLLAGIFVLVAEGAGKWVKRSASGPAVCVTGHISMVPHIEHNQLAGVARLPNCAIGL